MKRIPLVVFCALLVCLLCAACEQKQTQGTQQGTQEQQAEKKAEIPLDDPSLAGEASLARNFYFILDASGSMSDTPGGSCSGDKSFGTKLEGAKWAIHEFIKQVPDDANIGLYVFGRGVREELIPLSPLDREAFLEKVDAIKSGGNTPLSEAIIWATDKLITQYKKQLGYGDYRIIAVTDGEATEMPIPEAGTYAIKYSMPIYTIGLCLGADHELRKYSIQYKAADSMADLVQGLKETLAESESFDVTDFATESK